MRLGRYAFGLVLFTGALAGCRRSTEEPAPARTTTEVAPPASSAAPRRHAKLPEDPEKARASTAQWREHMEEEERERRLRYDRRQLPEHEAMLKLIDRARARYDQTREATEVEKARTAVRPMVAEMRKQIKVIDHWGESSNVVDDYKLIVDALEEPYPEALSAALSGDVRKLTRVRADVHGRLETVQAWLERAKTADDE